MDSPKRSWICWPTVDLTKGLPLFPLREPRSLMAAGGLINTTNDIYFSKDVLVVAAVASGTHRGEFTYNGLNQQLDGEPQFTRPIGLLICRIDESFVLQLSIFDRFNCSQQVGRLLSTARPECRSTKVERSA